MIVFLKDNTLGFCSMRPVLVIGLVFAGMAAFFAVTPLTCSHGPSLTIASMRVAGCQTPSVRTGPDGTQRHTHQAGM